MYHLGSELKEKSGTIYFLSLEDGANALPGLGFSFRISSLAILRSSLKKLENNHIPDDKLALLLKGLDSSFIKYYQNFNNEKVTVNQNILTANYSCDCTIDYVGDDCEFRKPCSDVNCQNGACENIHFDKLQ